MKTKASLTKSALALALLVFVGSFASLTSGCASTPTRESTGEYVDDSTITVKVKAALVRDPMVKSRDVHVETFKGVVQLSGFVDTNDEKIRAAQVAATIAGVRDVKNNLAIK